MTESPEARRRRLINLGELIALLALIVSALGVWIAWKSSKQDKPTEVVEHHTVVPLALRGTADSDGRALTFIPADPSHGLESLKVTIKGASPIDVGSDGRLSAGDVEGVLRGREKEAKDVTHNVTARIDTRYVEAGTDRHASGIYVLRYKWEGGGLFGGRSLRLVGLAR
jgi:hypothetical protein